MSDNENKNTIKDVKAYFASSDKPLGTSEFMEFWKSLSDEDKQYYLNADLS